MWKCISFEAFPFVSGPAQSFRFLRVFKISVPIMCAAIFTDAWHKKNCFLGDRLAQYAPLILRRAVLLAADQI